MIKLIPGARRHLHPREIASMHRLRAEIFHERMRWPVTVENGEEHDAFDDLDPLYVVACEPNGHVYASARLLPTTGPNMLADVFPDLLPDAGQVRSPTIWESSRFSVAQDETAERSQLAISARTAELLCGIVETGIAAGLEYVVSVVDVSVERVLRRAGCGCERLGPPRRIGQSLAIAGMFPMEEALLASIRRAGGVPGRVVDETPQFAWRGAA